MKKYLFLSILTVFSVFLISCSKDDEDDVTGKVANTYLKVKINGQQKSFSDVEGRWVEGGNFLEINATDDKGSEWVSITVLSEHTRVPAGTYSLDGNPAFPILAIYTLVGQNGSQANFTASTETLNPNDTFTLKIDAIDNGKVKGSFAGILVNDNGRVTLADGEFETTIGPN